ncbi:putative GCY1-galactose-induced protein of aldo/keto reductase family [Serendipita vermifera]|nr:putative GCY1-galactose-induced protein of aldo/keto reductase family [Serendipita vermifera]
MTALEIPTLTLNNGVKIPGIGMGLWMGSPGGHDEAIRTTNLALKYGYRHLDTASGYANEEAVGEALRNSDVPREEVFITTKLKGDDHGRVAEGFERSRKALGVEYIDLYLMHWPQAEDPETGRVLQPDESPTFVETWLSMEKLLETGKVKAIGVSNFSIKTLEVLLPKVNIVPAVNQIEIHPSLPNTELIEYCKAKGIVVTAYTPLGRPGAPFYTDSVFTSLAEKYQVGVGQILLSWAVMRGTIPIPKSSNPDRAKQNITLIQLAPEDIGKIDDFHKQPRMHRTLCFTKPEGVGIFGWTWEQLGWPMKQGGYID